jgi:SpoVK/Ycf46/Vps4 family AAA+-type ATPase
MDSDDEDDGPEAFRPVNDITEFAEVLRPADAEPPILSPGIRLAVRQWMVELSSEEALLEYGLRPRRSAILSGPPGCGKTTLAHHFAARLGLPLILVNMGSIVGQYLGSSQKNVNRLFDAIREQQERCVLFLDEFDAVATKRNTDNQAAARELNALVIALLQKIDTFTGTLIAATNRGDDIDPAIWRRFGMHLEITEPGDEARFAILKRYLSPMALPEKAMDFLTEATAGASPAVLRQLMEGIKRDVILSPRYDQKSDAQAVFSRLLASIRPHAGATLPPLWSEPWALESVCKIPWPPTDSRKEAQAA